jgi:sec-independent protein translocase protein TatA
MGDVAKGINSFKKGLADDATPPAGTPAPPSQITSQPAPTPVREEVPRS